MTNEESHHVETWRVASARAAAIIAISAAGFLLLPHLFATKMSARTTPVMRDGLILAWTVACMVATSWALVRAQRDPNEGAVPAEEED